MKLWKQTTAGAALLALCCVILLLSGWLPWVGQGLSVETNRGEALFYPGDAPKAVLIAAGENDTAYRAFVRSLQKSGVPVLITFHGPGAVEQPYEDLENLSQEMALLKEQTGLKEKDTFLVGYHYGATTLLNQLANSQAEYGGMVIMAPALPESLREDALVIGGNYSTQDQWLSGLSPQLVKQPVLLLSSAGDQVCDAYTMTLLYHYLSGDEIIHLGGIYQAQAGQVVLDIVDGGSHQAAGYHPVMVQRTLDFLNQFGALQCKMYWLEPWAGTLCVLLVAAVGVLGLCGAQLARGRFCTISYAIAPEKVSQGTGSFFIIKVLRSIGATAAGLVLFLPAKLLFPNFPLPLALFNSVAWGYGLLSFIGKKGVAEKRAKTGGQLPKLLAAGVLAGGLLPMAAIPFYGCAFRFLAGRDILGIVWGAAGIFLWMRFLLKEEELLKEQKSLLSVQLGCWILHFAPMAAVGAAYGLLFGGIAAFAQPMAILGLFAVFYVLAQAAFVICGSASWPALAAALAAQAVAVSFFIF